jgi:hypothetical protein
MSSNKTSQSLFDKLNNQKGKSPDKKGLARKKSSFKKPKAANKDEIIVMKTRDTKFKESKDDQTVLMAVKPQMPNAQNLKAYNYLSDQKKQGSALEVL